jgi:alpha-tubulin suppressor-like RCC1 family protein
MMKTLSKGLLNPISLAVIAGALCAPMGATAGGLVAAWGDWGGTKLYIPQGLRSVKAVADGGNHDLALKTDGTVVAWGSPGYGQSVVPADLSGVIAIGAGFNHSVALRVDGTVRAWGDNSLRQTNVPAGLTSVIAIAAGDDHNLALKEDGTVVAWGYNAYGQTNVPAGLSNVIAVAAGRHHSLAVKVDGTVIGWGGNGWGEINIPPGLTQVRAVAGGGEFSLALKADGTVVGWGDNAYGQATPPPGLSNVIAIAAGTYHGLALKSDGAVIAWGYNHLGSTDVPAVLTNATAISAGLQHSLAIVFDGPPQILEAPPSQVVPWSTNISLVVTVAGWQPLSCQWFFKGAALTNCSRVSGATTPVLTINPLQFSDTGTYTLVVSNAFGSVVSLGAVITVVGPPVITQQPVGRTVAAGSDVTFTVAAEGPAPLSYRWQVDGTAVAGATRATLTLTNLQPAHSGGYSAIVSNGYGSVQSLAAVLTVTNTAPYVVRQPAGQTSPLGGSATFSIVAKGSLPLTYQWRFNGNDITGATGSALAMGHLRYDQSGFYNVVVRNALGQVISAKALLSVVQAAVWGEDGFGLAGPYPNPYAPTNVPPGLTNLVAVAAGALHVLALKPDGRVATWASSYLPEPYNSVTNIPASVSNVAAVAAAEVCSMVLRSNGTVVAWGGFNPWAPAVTNVPAGLSNVVAIATGGYHCLALKSNGTVIGWGSAPPASVPVGLSNVIAVAAGTDHNLALRLDGTVMAWGNNTYGQLTVPPGLSNVIAVAAGTGLSLALKTDGTVAAWGAIQPGDAAAQAGFTNVVALASGGQRCYALRADGSVLLSGTRPPLVPAGLSNVAAIAAGGVAQVEPDRPLSFFVALVGNGSPVMTLQPVSQTPARGATVRLHARAVGVQPLSYQWQLDGQDLIGATNASLTLTNVQGRDGGAYRLVAANALGTATSSAATLSIPYSGTWAAALNTTNVAWVVGISNRPWFTQNRMTHDGEGAAQSGAISHSQQSYLQTTITGPGTLRFWWKVSSEEGFDVLKCYQDITNNLLASISGEMGWEQRTFAIPPGAHTVRWLYIKDATVSDGQDAGWLDEVSWVPGPPAIAVQPMGLTGSAGSDVGLEVLATGTLPLTYQWLKGGLDLAGATQSRLLLPNVGRRDAGVYAVRVSNPGGSTLSSNAALWVRVPQRLGPPTLLSDGSLSFRSSDADGGSLRPEDMSGFEVQASTDLRGWLTLTNVLSWTNGSLWLRDPERTNSPRRFYRVLETTMTRIGHCGGTGL